MIIWVVKLFLVQFFCVFLPPLLNIFCFCLVHTISVLYQAHLCMKCSLGMSNFLEEISAAAAAKSLQSCPTLCDPRNSSPPGSPIPGILQANTGVDYHFLLQCMKVKSESEVAQSCPTLSSPMDCSPPGSSIHGIFQVRVLECSTIKPYATPAAAAKLLQLCPTLCNPIDGSPSGSPVPGILQARRLEWVAISFSSL